MIILIGEESEEQRNNGLVQDHVDNDNHIIAVDWVLPTHSALYLSGSFKP